MTCLEKLCIDDVSPSAGTIARPAFILASCADSEHPGCGRVDKALVNGEQVHSFKNCYVIIIVMNVYFFFKITCEN